MHAIRRRAWCSFLSLSEINSMSTHFETFYQDAPLALTQELRQYRATHHPRHTMWNGVTWTYTVSGTGEQPVLWLVGALRVGDAAFRSIPLLEDGFKLIVQDYLTVMSIAEVVDGLAYILPVVELRMTPVLT